MDIFTAYEQVLRETDPPPKNEAATCKDIIVPILDALGYMRKEIEPESSDNKSGRPDYTILPDTPHKWFLEAKSWSVRLDSSYAVQACNYANSEGARWVVLTNGMVWQLYDNSIQGVPAQKFVREARLADKADFLNFIGVFTRHKVTSGEINSDVLHWNLNRYLDHELTSVDGFLLKTIHRTIKKEPGFESVKLDQMVSYFNSLKRCSNEKIEIVSGSITVPALKVVSNSGPNDQSSEIAKYSILELVSIVTGTKPTDLTLPDGSVVSVKSWIDILKYVLEFAIRIADVLPPVPFCARKNAKRYFLNSSPVHPDGSPMSTYISIKTASGKICIHTHLSARDILTHCISVLEEMKVNPSDFRVRIR